MRKLVWVESEPLFTAKIGPTPGPLLVDRRSPGIYQTAGDRCLPLVLCV